MGEQTLRMKAEADVTALTQYAGALRQARHELDLTTQSMSRNQDAASRGIPAPQPPHVGTNPGIYQVTTDSQGRRRGAGGQFVGGGGGGGGFGGGGGPQASTNSAGGGLGLGGMARRGGSFIGRAASTAVGLGLGSSISGFFLQSGQKYLELSKVITHVGRRFREAGDNAAYFGGKMGYTIAQSSQFAETLGTRTNTINRGQMRRYLGFARDTGLDPSVAMAELGGLERNVGGELTDRQLMNLRGRARSMNMGQGRFGEFIQSTSQLAQLQLQATGGVNLAGTLSAQALPAQVFGANDARAQGSQGVGFMNRLQGVMTQGGPMQAYMMRVMGYGREDGPDYMTMRKRLHEGVFNKANMKDLFGSFKQQGLGQAGMYRALESVSGGKLSPHDLELLVGKLGTDKGMAEYMASDMSGEDFVKSMTKEEQAMFAQKGHEGLGTMRGRVSQGEWRSAKLERMQMQVGDTVSKVMDDMTDTLGSLASGFKKVIGTDLTGVIEGLSGTIKSLAHSADMLADPVGRLGGGKAAVASAAADVGTGAAYVLNADTPSKAIAAGLAANDALWGPVLEATGVYGVMGTTRANQAAYNEQMMQNAGWSARDAANFRAGTGEAP